MSTEGRPPAIAFIICGALAREVLAIVERRGWCVDVFGIPAIDHMYPDRIAPHVEKKIESIHTHYRHILVVYGDCGSKGVLDKLLDQLDMERIEGPHCYEMYGGSAFSVYLDEEPGTFFLTDFLVRGYRGTIWRGLGLDRYPELKDEYFRHYRRIVYFTQAGDPNLSQKAQQIADELGLSLQIHHTGYGLLETRLVDWMERHLTEESDLNQSSGDSE